MGIPSRSADQLVSENGLLLGRDAASKGVTRMTLSRWVAAGDLVRVTRGVYQLPGARPVDPLAIFCVTHPRYVVCLLSALALHGLTTHVPQDAWIAIGNKSVAPRCEFPPLRLVRMSERLLMEMIDIHSLDGVPIRITSPERTIADCFKFRNRIGTDIATEALHTAWESDRVNMKELWEAAKITRMTNVMRPYLELLR